MIETVIKYKIYDYMFSTKIIEIPDGTWEVDTPISRERYFITENDAREYASSFGNIDKRKYK